MHRAFVICVFNIDSFDGLFISSRTSKITSLVVGLLLVLLCACAFGAVFRFVWKKLAFVSIGETAIPVAGRGTRVQTATNAIQKGLLSVYDRSFIEQGVKQAIAVDIIEIIRGTRDGKEAIGNHYE